MSGLFSNAFTRTPGHRLGVLLGVASILLFATPGRSVSDLLERSCAGRQHPAPRQLSRQLVEPLKECLGNVVGPAPKEPIALELALRIGPGGEVQSVETTGSENADSGFLECARRRATRLFTSPPNYGSGSMLQGFLFLPAEPGNTLGGAPPVVDSDFLHADRQDGWGPTPLIVLRLQPTSSDAGVRLARHLRGKVETCTEDVVHFTGKVGLELQVSPDGAAGKVAVAVVPQQPVLTRCLQMQLTGAQPTFDASGETWQVRLDFILDDKGVSLVL